MGFEDQRKAEFERYSEIYRTLPHYKMGGARFDRFRAFLQREKPKTLLDVGCGRGETIANAKLAGIDATGAEVVDHLTNDDVVLIEGAHDLPFTDRQFEAVTCLDVLEHLIPEDTNSVLQELVRVTDRVLFVTVAWFSHHVPRYGELHINKHETRWWTDKLENEIDGIDKVSAHEYRNRTADITVHVA